jgi:peptide deformylase
MTDRDEVEMAARAAEVGAQMYVASPWSGPGVTPFGNACLHSPTESVEQIDSSVELVASYMIEIMHERRGIGLAANQIGLSWRMFVHNLPTVAPQVVINPQIIDVDDVWSYSEGCLSLTIEGSRAAVRRPKRVLIEAVDLSGATMRIAADELLARVFQHEIDHLDGIVYVQRLEGQSRSHVYDLMSANGVDTSLLPSKPYSRESS